MVKIPPNMTEAEYRKERDALDSKGFFFEPVRSEDEKTKLLDAAARYEEAKARQAEAKSFRPSTALPPLANPMSIVLEFATSNDTATVDLKYLVDPFLPAGCVVGFYGRGATGKSPFLASIAAHVSTHASTLWVSVEEPADWIKVRHIAAGGAERTLLVVTAVASKKDHQGRVVGSSFNIYEHLEPAIERARAATAGAHAPERPIKLIVLDTAVGLTTWGNGAGPNSDDGVKRLLAYLQALAERHDLTIAIIGHANKGKHDHFADTVMGATAWTNSPRLSFIHAADRREEYAFVLRVAKTNLNTFGMTYKTVPIHTLYRRQNGPDTVLCKVEPGSIVWGDTASMELWDEATVVPKEDEGFVDVRTPTIVEKVIQFIVETLMTTAAAQITRDEVEQNFGRPIGRREWGKVDAHLQNHPTVLAERGTNNRVIYRRHG